MSMSSAIKGIIEERLKTLHTAFLAKILSVNGTKAKIQPLGLVRDYGGTEKAQAVITGVHISQSARYKFTTPNITYVYNAEGDTKTQTIAVPVPICAGDIVLCVCCDRNIDAALKGVNSLPPAGHHNKSDCVIVSII